MHDTVEKIIEFSNTAPFSINIKSSRFFPDEVPFVKQHYHGQCEIYINMTGNVSFMVEDSMYSIQRGSVIITRSQEKHHCIYHSNEEHRHFWILINAQKNDPLFDMFFKRKLGSGNLIEPLGNSRERLIALGHCLMQAEDKIEQYSAFFEMLYILHCAQKDGSIKNTATPKDVAIALEYIREHFTNEISVMQLAEIGYVSVNTLVRHFKEHLGVTPYRYIIDSRLSYAIKLLRQGETIAIVSDKSGFANPSAFIAAFKKKYNTTPLQYIKQNNIVL